MKRKNQNKCYHTRFVTLIIIFRKTDQIFHPITLLKRMLITNQYAEQSYSLINSVINAFTTLLRRIFILRVFKA